MALLKRKYICSFGNYLLIGSYLFRPADYFPVGHKPSIWNSTARETGFTSKFCYQRSNNKTFYCVIDTLSTLHLIVMNFHYIDKEKIILRKNLELCLKGLKIRPFIAINLSKKFVKIQQLNILVHRNFGKLHKKINTLLCTYEHNSYNNFHVRQT